MKHAVIINGLSSARIGQAVELAKHYEDDDSSCEYVALAEGEHCHYFRRDCLRLIGEEEYEMLKPKNSAIKEYITSINEEQ